MAESRQLTDSVSFPTAADNWAKNRGLLDSSGNITARYPSVLGVLDGSPDLGAFNNGIIGANRTVKQAFQDVENALNVRLVTSKNLSDLTNRAAARANLELGSVVTYNVGTSGAVLPLLNTINTWTGQQIFNGTISVGSTILINSAVNNNALLMLANGNSTRWLVGKLADAETGNNTGSSFFITRCSDAGLTIDSPLTIDRATGTVRLQVALPLTSGGTGANSVSGARTNLQINNVDNTKDVDKPISTATQNALNNKFDKSGGIISGYININSNSPTLFLQDTDHRSSMLQCNNNNFYVLRGDGINATTWNQVASGRNPLTVSLETGDLQTGGAIDTMGLMVRHTGTADFIGSVNRYTGLGVVSGTASSSTQANGIIDFRNENSVNTATINVLHDTNGASVYTFYGTAAGARNVDRRVAILTMDTNAITPSVPINGRAFPRRTDGAPLNFEWNGQPGQPTYLWGGENGQDMKVYTPANFSVNYANNAGGLNGVTGGDGGGYIRRSTADGANPPKSASLIVCGDGASDYAFSPALQVREVNRVANSQSSMAYSPGITFHWASMAASAIRIDTGGHFNFVTQGADLNFRSIVAADHVAFGWFRSKSNTGIYWDNYNRGLSVADNGSAYGNVNVQGVGLNGWSGYSINGWMTMMANGSGGGSGRGFYSSDQSMWLLQWDGGGNAVFPANITAYSDERLKNLIGPIDNVEARIRGMAEASFRYERKNNLGVVRIGFNAQKLEPSNPEVVFTAEDEVGTKSVNYGDTVATLSVGVTELYDRMAAVEAENQGLRELVETLLARLNKE